MKIFAYTLFVSLAFAGLLSTFAITSKKSPLSPANTISDLKQICQLTLNLPELDLYFKNDPYLKSTALSILENQDIRTSMPLTMLDKQVEFVSQLDTSKRVKPYIEFFNVSIEENTASIMFIYPNGRIDGIVNFIKNDNNWEVAQLEFTEF